MCFASAFTMLQTVGHAQDVSRPASAPGSYHRNKGALPTAGRLPTPHCAPGRSVQMTFERLDIGYSMHIHICLKIRSV